ncbi:MULTISPECIES: hypothetical protein [Legionella]|uniref:Uncharacterized protein n=1 Tax=Legionella steelei TaxID=947033 RepID=A0A0W0ZFB6_9GAMM|nr:MULTISPECIES: hypothetical protein [Legionella]KTD67720.1 hypothetical protein Lste_0878 [Legionella steelei]MBN9228439.1 hypothetical protein [Legionella steelei]OJW09001.1 MAG: hypothetical protein BGO44_15480 [Legionella sp. 39-23]
MRLFPKKEQSKALVRFVFLAGLFGIAILFFESLSLHDAKDKSDGILFAISIYVFLLAFFAGKPVERLRSLCTILFGLVLMCFSIFFQVFYFRSISMTHMLFTFICLGCMWGLGRTLSVIVTCF